MLKLFSQVKIIYCWFDHNYVEPTTFKLASTNPTCLKKSHGANALIVNNTWTITDLHLDSNDISCKWVYKNIMITVLFNGTRLV